MRVGVVVAVGLLVLPVSGFALSHAHRGPTSHKAAAGRRSAKVAARPASQRSIDPERATQIQTALIHSGYLSGEASGKWDAETEAAMQRYQAANGWQTKLIPDSRAIIKLGLGSTSAGTSGAQSVTGAPASSGELVSTLSSQ